MSSDINSNITENANQNITNEKTDPQNLIELEVPDQINTDVLLRTTERIIQNDSQLEETNQREIKIDDDRIRFTVGSIQNNYQLEEPNQKEIKTDYDNLKTREGSIQNDKQSEEINPIKIKRDDIPLRKFRRKILQNENQLSKTNQIEIVDDPLRTTEESIQNDNQLEDTNQVEIKTDNVPLRRSKRKIIHPIKLEQPVVLPKLKKITEISSIEDIKKYYLDKKVGRPSTLETIFEDCEVKKSMSAKKYKRFIDFKVTASNNNNKLKKRRKKITLLLGKRKSNRKVSIELLKKTLESVNE